MAVSGGGRAVAGEEVGWAGERPSERMTFALTQKDHRVTAAGRVFTSQGKFLLFFLFLKKIRIVSLSLFFN